MESLYELTGTEAAKVLVLKNNLTIDNANDLKKILLEAINTTDHLIIYFENITSVDLTCIQLFCAANESFLKENKHISLKGEIPHELLKVVSDAGIDAEYCDAEYYDKCLWKSGGLNG